MIKMILPTKTASTYNEVCTYLVKLFGESSVSYSNHYAHPRSAVYMTIDLTNKNNHQEKSYQQNQGNNEWSTPVPRLIVFTNIHTSQKEDYYG